MKVLSIAAVGVSLVSIALTLAPFAGDYRTYFAVGALICSVVALATIVGGWRDRPAERDRPIAPAASQRVEPPPSPAVPAREISNEAAVVAFLATLQEKGRFVDFVQDDIAAYGDAQVGAAARVVHVGCKAVLDEYVRIVPVREESEGARVTVPTGYAAGEYRLVGKISGQAPFSGTLMHRGWKAQSVTLPGIVPAADARLPTIAPAEVELR